jgi:hypothetical protein
MTPERAGDAIGGGRILACRWFNTAEQEYEILQTERHYRFEPHAWQLIARSTMVSLSRYFELLPPIGARH